MIVKIIYNSANTNGLKKKGEKKGGKRELSRMKNMNGRRVLEMVT